VAAEVCFQDLARQVRSLLGCGAVNLFLGCPEPELRHPLLDLFSTLRKGRGCIIEKPLREKGVQGAQPPAGGTGVSPEHLSFLCRGEQGRSSLGAAKPYPYISSGGDSSPDDAVLLRDERVRALCDIAMQTGQVQCISQASMDIEDVSIQSIAVAPLERPAGLLGFFLLTNPFANAFSHGERLLLSHYLPLVAQSLERDLRNQCSMLSRANLTSTNGGSPPAMMTDVLELERVRQDSTVHNEFISMVSHELRTPLTAIKGYAGLLQAYGVTDYPSENGKEEMTPARQQQYLNIIMEQTRHLEVLISDLLDISRIHAGRMTLRRSYVNVALLCQRVAHLIQHRVDQQQPQQYRIRCNLTPELPLAWADSDRVQQVLTNLLENAVKYSPDGGLIEVLAHTCPTSDSLIDCMLPKTESEREVLASQEPLILHVTVRDWGIGISSKQQSQLFKPFGKLDHPATSQVPGVGLGLYITRKLVEAMGGTIALCSSEGEGTSVTFTLPVEPAEALPVKDTPVMVPAVEAESFAVLSEC